MKENTYYNLEKIIKIVVKDIQISATFVYKKEKKFLGIRLMKEGIYDVRWNERYDMDHEFTDIFLKDDNVYKKAKCTLFFEDGHILNYLYDTYELALSKSIEIMNKTGNWLSIENDNF